MDRNVDNWMRRGFWISFDFDLFREFEYMQREMNAVLDQFDKFTINPPKELKREYEGNNGSKVREVGPIIYGYSMTIGPDGRLKIQEFGNVKPKYSRFESGTIQPRISAEREPLVDINLTDKEVKVVLEIPGVKKDNIKINAYDGILEITTSELQRKYHRTLELPEEVDIDTARATYNNGIIEITFNKKTNKSNGKEIKID